MSDPLEESEDTKRPSPARMYDYLLGGYYNFAADRQAAEQMISLVPNMRIMAQTNRAFLQRAVTFLVEQGIEQFLDLGSGIPTVGNVHEVVQRLNPTAHVIYVDVDPIAVAQSKAILGSNPTTAIIQMDMRNLDGILSQPDAARLLDLSKPLGVLLVSVLQFIPGDNEASTLVHRLRDRVVPGSYLALSHPTSEGIPQVILEEGRKVYARSTHPAMLRSRAQIEALFAGFDLIEPGVVYPPLWRPIDADDLAVNHPEQSQFFVGIGRLP